MSPSVFETIAALTFAKQFLYKCCSTGFELSCGSNTPPLKKGESVPSLNLFKESIFLYNAFYYHKENVKNLYKDLYSEKDKILQSFLNKEYFCYMTGFIAGMPFLGDIDSKIRLERLKTPRVKVPKGSVGITEQFCNIYTFESPGGWNIIGNTPIKVFDKFNESNPLIINPGDRVVFYRINKDEYLKFNE